ncbi:uncharacterized protein Cpr51A [Anabrus simplex]|uniref:uncharacterized protein Cpr51A n=1 Tax=Anabrus simplex TaxID=316456 RepID=UPI0035A29DA0
MLRNGLSLFLMAVAVSGAVVNPDKLEELRKMEAEQNANAHYTFQTDVNDHISDLTQHRQETREGLSLKGSFGYSDGFLRRVVIYEADENGYRVLSDKTEQLPGPQANPNGIASVHTLISGSELNYSIQKVPVDNKRAKGIKLRKTT